MFGMAHPPSPSAMLSLRHPWRTASALTYFFHSPTLSTAVHSTLKWGMGAEGMSRRSDFFFHLLYRKTNVGCGQNWTLAAEHAAG